MRTCTLIVAMLLPTAAIAADLPRRVTPTPLPVAQPISFAGFYVGVNGGIGWQTKDETIAGADDLTAAVVSSGFIPSSVATRGNGALVGGTIGYNYGLGSSFIVGAEGDIDWSNIKGSGQQSLALGPFGLSTTAETKTKWMGTLRARLGWLPSPNTMFFVTGGGAVAGVDNATTITLTTPFAPLNAQAASSVSDTKWGWTVGAGIEHKFAQSWSVKAEYRYVDLGGIDTAFGATVLRTPVGFTSHQDLNYHIALFGVNYNF